MGGQVAAKRFTETAESGFERIPAIHVPTVLSKALPIESDTGSLLAAWALIGFCPSIVNTLIWILGVPGPLTTLRSNLILLCLSVVNIGMFAAASITWFYLTNAVERVDAAAQPNDVDLHQVDEWLGRCLSPSRQRVVIVVTMALSLAVFSIAKTGVAGLLEITWVSFLAVAFSSAIGGNIYYWLVCAPQIPLRLRSVELAMVSAKPKSTPFMLSLRFTYALAWAAVILGLVGLEVFLLLVPDVSDSRMLRVIGLSFFPFAGLTALYVGLTPFFGMSRIAQRFVQSELVRLDAERSRAMESGQYQLATAIAEDSRLLQTAPTGTFSFEHVIQLAIGTVLAFLTLVLTLIFKT